MGSAVERRKFVGRSEIHAYGGIYSKGMPVLGSGDPTWWTQGTVYHLDNSHAAASNSNTGKNPEKPLSTLVAAIAKCTANKGDIVLIHEGHAETIASAATSPDVNIAGVTVIGLGRGEKRPTLTFTHVDAALKFGGANTKIYNVLLKCNVDSQNIVVDINAKDVTVEGCEIREGSAKQFLVGIDINGGGANACDRARLIGNKIVQTADGGSAAIELGAVADEVEIVGNEIDGDWNDAGIHNPVGTVMTNLRLHSNYVRNRDAGEHAIELVSACTGEALGNYLVGDTLGTIFDPGSLHCLDNWETNAVDVAAIPSPNGAAAPAPAGPTIAAANLAADALQAIQDEAEDALEGEALDHLAAAADGAGNFPASVVDQSILSKLVSKVAGGDTSSYDNTTDSLEMASDKLGAFSGSGGAAQDDSAKASLDLLHTLLGVKASTGETDLDEGDYDWAADYPALLTITPVVNAPLGDVVVYLDMAKAVEGFAAHYVAQTIQFHVERKVDGVNWRRDAGVLAAALAGNAAAARLVKVEIGAVAVAEAVRITAILSAEVDGTENTQIPYVVYFRGLAAPTIAPLNETP